MSDETSAPAGGDAIAVITPASDAPETFSISQAAEALTAARKPKEPAAESAEPATADPELAQANADPVEEQPISEDTNEAEPEALPPIDPPRSWTQAEKERFQSLPRETQEYLHTREQEREREFRRSQNEIAEERKAAKAERETADKLRQEYEAGVKSAKQALLDSQNDRFPDIKSMDDYERLTRAARELSQTDPFKALEIQTYLSDFNAHQQRLQLVAQEAQKAENRQSHEHQSKWTQHVQEENAKAAEYIPELADKTKGPALTARAADRLSELGFKPEELAKLASGQEKLSLYDHRIQRLIFSDLKLSDIQSAKTAVAAKPLPPVQRPGTAKPSGSAQSERIQALTTELNKTGSLKVAQELRALQSRRA